MAAPSRLRVVQVWQGTPIEERSYTLGSAMVRLGAGDDDFVVPPALGLAGHVLLGRGGGGFVLRRGAGMIGNLHAGGRSVDLAGLAGPSEHALGPLDWGIVGLDASGDMAFYFEVMPPVPLLPRRFTVDGFLVSGLAFAGLVHGVVLLVAFLLFTGSSDEDLSEQPDRVARLMLDKDWPVPIAEREQRLEEEKKRREEGRKARERDTSKRAAGKEGKFGDPSKRGETKLAKGPRDVIAAKVQTTGLLGALKQTKGDSSLARLLSSDKDADMTTALAGVHGVVRSEIGQGVGGLSTRGTGPGGGGTGTGGQIYGIGNLKTGGGGDGRGGGGGGRGGVGTGHQAKEKALELRTAEASTDGSLTKEQVNKVVISHAGAIQFCYEKELQRFPKLQGKVILSWRIEVDGTVTNAKVASSTLDHPATEGCMVRQLKAWIFPKSQGAVTQVNYPFLFRGQ